MRPLFCGVGTPSFRIRLLLLDCSGGEQSVENKFNGTKKKKKMGGALRSSSIDSNILLRNVD